MKTLFCTLAGLVAFVFPATGQDTHIHITGEVFIVTAGGDNKLLGRVEVSAYKPDEVAAAFKAVDDEITITQPAILAIYQQAKQLSEEAQRQVDAATGTSTLDGLEAALKVRSDAHSLESKAASAYEYTKGACKYFSHLPTPIASVKTDSQGKYDLVLSSSNPVILAAHSTRQAGGSVEDYFWIIKCDPSQNPEMTLSNDNLADSGSKDSVITTNADEWEGEQGMPLYEAAKAHIEEQAKKTADKAKEAAQQQHEALMDQYRANPTSAENEAVALYPDLGKAGTAINKEFTTRYKLYKTSNPQFFDEPDWPIRLAKECAEAVQGR